MTRICIFMLICLLLSGCEDIFEQDIRNTLPEVVTPKDNTHIGAGTVTFLWRTGAGVRSYRLTIVSPSFADAAYLVADTTLQVDSLHAADRYLLTLDEGTYQWSLQGVNGVYKTKESIYTLRVDPRTPSGSNEPDDPADGEHPIGIITFPEP